MSENTQITNSTPEGTGGRLFTQEQVNQIVSDRLAREREKMADGSEYKAKYESVLAELEGMKANQLHQQKEAAYRDLLARANIAKKRVATVLKASAAEVDALELDENGTMNDYDRNGKKSSTQWSRYGNVSDLDATTEEFTLTRDRSFTFAIDKLDTDETAQQLAAASALARQNREVVIPEVDSYTYGVMCSKAGHKPDAKALTASNIYTEILAASEALDNAECPEAGRVLVVTPAIYALMKKCKDIVMETDIGTDLRLKGVIGILDGMSVQKIPANRLPAGFGFMVCHPVATVAPVKLEDYTVHENPPGISGSLVEGRICYGAFVLDNKANAIYYQAQPAATPPGGEG